MFYFLLNNFMCTTFNRKIMENSSISSTAFSAVNNFTNNSEFDRTSKDALFTDIPFSLLYNFTNNTKFNRSTHSENSPLKSYYPIFAAELGLSIICSISLIVIYIFIGEHRTLPGKNVISISCCLIVTYIMLTIDLLMRDIISFEICEAIGIIVQTTFLATFFWTNVMSYDIMKTMASLKPDSERTTNYWKYALYAWSMTLLCVIPAVAIDHTHFVPADYRPNFGVKKCWLTGQLAFLMYFNAPVGITLIANCIFFVRTAKTIVQVRSATSILAANRHKKRFRLCMKLVLIMGLVWITEFIPWLTGIYYLYAVAGMLNCLHGVYLFIIFACKRRTLKQLFSSTCCCNYSIKIEKRKQQSPSLDTVTTLTF